MNLEDLKLQRIGINKEKLGRVFCFIDFGNVNYWYSKDRTSADGAALWPQEKIIVDVSMLSDFLRLFSEQRRFYYGWHQRIKYSWHIIIRAERSGCIKVTKPIQFIRHYFDGSSATNAGGSTRHDSIGKYIEVPKSNFDVEISVDAIRLADKYDTFCLLSGDSDFARLAEFLKRKGKRVMIIAAGKVFHTLKVTADLYINAQGVKPFITRVKETPPH